MANNNNEGADNSPDNSKDSGSDKSFVGKFVSGIINSTPLSKWFGKESASKSIIRRREEDEEYDGSYSFQPPSKRAKLPTDVEHNNYSAQVFESPVTVHASNNINNVSSRVFRKFPEPVPGPSGIKSRKLFEKHNTSSTNTVSTNSFENQLDLVNGEHDSDSEESTSGYSSAPKLLDKTKSTEDSNNKEVCEKATPKTRSLFAPSNDSGSGRTLFAERSPQMNTSLSSRRPTFNASTFGSPNFVDRTLSTKRIMNSPFYSGHTIYGGASAYGRRLGRNAEDMNASRTSVQIKPVNEKLSSENTTLSKTARRILSTLEQYSTPISDAKKIPVTPRKTGLLSSYVGATPYLVRDRKKPSNKELQVPSVPDLLQMKQKERLQNSTETVRQIATQSKSSLNKEEYKLRTEEDNKQKHNNKMKTSVASARQKVQSIEPVSEVKLPKVSLPITTLPKFDFVLMPPSNSSQPNKTVNDIIKSPHVTKSPVSTVIKSTIVVDKQETEKKIGNVNSNYTFSEPLVIAKDLKSVTGINCFKFSEPLCQKPNKSSESNFKPSGFKTKNNGENLNLIGVAKPAPQLVKKNDNFKTIGTRWECPTCLVKNDADKTQCSACDEPKPETQKGFGDQFKLTAEKWECNSCMVRNNNSDKTCVACASAKPGEDKPTVKSGFGDKFKPPASTWECTSCLIRNKDESDSCAACGTAKPTKVSNWGDKFKPSSDTWECSSCMIRNKKDLDKCAACETAKPGSKTVSKSFNTSGTKFSFGIKTEWECQTCMIKNKNDLKKCAACEMPRDGETEKKGFGDAFKIKGGEWECSSCMVKNKSTTDACVCCGVAKPGSSKDKVPDTSQEKKPVISFNFGIDKASAAQFKFGIPSEVKESTPPTFAVAEVAKPPAVTSTSFSFGINTQEKVAPVKPSEAASPNPLLKPSEKLPEKVTPAPVGFKFGLDSSNKQVSEAVVSSSSTKTDTSTASTFSTSPAPTFNFKPAAVNGDISKPKDGGDAKISSNIFGRDFKPKETLRTETSRTQESPFVKVTIVDPPYSRKSDSPFAASKYVDPPYASKSKPVDSPFGTSKFVDPPYASKSKTVDPPFGGTSKPVDPPFGRTSKPVESPFGSTSKPVDPPFGTAPKPQFGNVSKPTDSPFSNVKPIASPFAKPELPFVSKPTESPFGNASDASKPKESLFGAPSDATKPQGALFGNVTDASKPQETLFGNDATKPKEVLFGSKPSESNLFSTPTSTPTFTFTPKPAETTGSSFSAPATTSQPASSAIFKFGTDAPPSQVALKRTFGDTTDTNVSNGFGSGPKISAFGAPQGFASEAKPFAFGGEAAPKSTGFSFAQTDKPAPVFNFGGGPPTATSVGFNFAVPATGFNFGGAAKVESQPFNAPSGNVFGAGGTAAKNGSFNFGTNTNNNNQKAVFTFGANQTGQQSQPNFPTQGQTGFSFGAPAPLNAPPTGSFNFTGPPPSFNFPEGSSAPAQPQRKIMKAYRRTHR